MPSPPSLSAFNVMGQPTGAIFNLACQCCFFLSFTSVFIIQQDRKNEPFEVS